MKRIFLIGYMGSGKSTIGKELARRMNLSFIDTDFFIENRYRKSVREIFAEKGEEGFRKIERSTLEEVSGFENAVISTGGGAPCFFDNMQVMNANGLTVYLKVSIEELAKRLENGKANRPLLKDKNIDELRSFISEALSQREYFYNQSHIVFDAEHLLTQADIQTIVSRLLQSINEFTL